MPKIRYQHSHSLADDLARARLEELLQQFSDKYHFKATWVDDAHAKIKGQGVSGQLDMEPGQVSFNLDLSLLLSPLKSRIESAIVQELARALS